MNTMHFFGKPLSLCLVLLVALLPGGCNMARVEPRRDLYGHLPAHFVHARPGEETACVTWQQSFPSAILLADLKRLDAQNYTLAAARSKVTQTAMQYGLVAASLGPSPLSVNTQFQRERETEDNGEIIRTDTFTLSSQLAWEADIWGRLRAKKKAAALLVEEQKALAGQTRLTLQTRLVMHWIAHHTAVRLAQLTAAQQEQNRQLLELIRVQAGLGLASRLDVLRQSRHLAALDKSVAGIGTDLITSANAYAILLGRLPSGEKLLPEPLPCPKPLLSLPGPRQLLALRPDLQAGFAALEAADQEVAAAIADRLPRIAFGVSLEVSGSKPMAIGDDSVVTLFSNLLAPVFDAGRKAMAVKQCKAQAQTALALLHQTMLDAFLEVENAAAKERRLFSKLALLDRERTFAGQISDEAMFRYVNGEETFLSVLRADISQNRLARERVYCQSALLLNRAQLLQALGVIMSDPCAQQANAKNSWKSQKG